MATSSVVAELRKKPGVPLVSAVITSYNYGHFLAGAIESVLAQTYPNVEIVVVDDGSTDDTRAVAARYEDRGVRYLYQDNAGAAAARNRGIAATMGPIVAFCDADDSWLPTKLALQCAHLDAHPDIALVSAHAFACDEAMQPMSIVHAARGDSRYVFEALLVRNIVLNPTCVLARRDALDAVGGFSDLSRWEDWDTWLRVANHFPIGFVDAPVAYVRRHDASLSPIDGRQRFELDAGILERHIGNVERRWKRAVIRVQARSNAYFHAATTLASRGDRRAARIPALLAVVLDPTRLTARKAALVGRTWLPAAFFGRVRRVAKSRTSIP